MKRVIRNTLLLCICMLTAALTACQATPDAPIVVQKDMEQMLEKAQNDIYHTINCHAVAWRILGDGITQ